MNLQIGQSGRTSYLPQRHGKNQEINHKQDTSIPDDGFTTTIPFVYLCGPLCLRVSVSDVNLFYRLFLRLSGSMVPLACYRPKQLYFSMGNGLPSTFLFSSFTTPPFAHFKKHGTLEEQATMPDNRVFFRGAFRRMILS
jgi:hypothetical protein